ncbi:hypothetical protein SD70_22915 [Gordoniibacillus kamchatkensis]|uniref:F5/8 type C domain-containing protein n=1 Tax=Gordoniibacillus kamchatkensis TaxID=1590651 RepID=A0ABR5AD77_9BACL|nr:X2-like carbohydrate binding domain-containing protein [Paenibacillus sp. VKM B-2647]KIL38994.1 hypothetical protein SD70_22915 [Paenibacillus sp. VKM B-2647]
MKRAMRLIVLVALVSLLFNGGILSTGGTAVKAQENDAVQLYVAKDGNDANDGSLLHPFATLEKARDAIRALKSAGAFPAGGVSVQIRGGEYKFAGTFQLDEQDSGTAGAPVVYKAYGGEKVTFTGGIRLNDSLFKPVTDQAVLARLPLQASGKVLQADLQALGITDYGTLGNNQAVAPELFFNGNVMTLARWPNNGFTTVTQVVYTPDSAANKGYTFTYQDEGLRRWQSIDDTWMLGYWGNDWATNDLQIKSIDFDAKSIETYKGTSYAMKAGQRFYFYNVLEELDTPGEWYLDRKTGKLYLYPPAPIQGKKVQLSLFASNLISMNNASNIVFSGLAMEVSRGNAIDIAGGENNRIENCDISKMGGYAVKINGGRNNGVYGCRIYSMGNGGVSLNGGDFATLTPAGNYADNNDIFNYARIKLTYTSAVELNGVGNRATHNKMHGAPHLAIQFRGNDHLIEYNEIYDVVKETADASAIYSGRSLVWRGNVIRYNYIHDIVASNLRVSTAAIYLDDYMSGVEMYGNVFYNIGKQAFKLANGRENVVENNIVIDSGTSIAFLTRNYKPGEKNYESLMSKFNQVPYQSEIWSARYPTLPGILNDEPLLPKRNVVRNNAIVNSGEITGDSRNMELGTFENNVAFGSKEEVGFVDAAAGNFELRDDAALFAKIPQFQSIPFGKIGIHADGLPPAQSEIGIRYMDYRQNAGDIAVKMKLNGNSLLAISDGTKTLAAGTDYISSGNSVILKRDYLATLPLGPTSLTFSFSAGNDAYLVVHVAQESLAANKSYEASSTWNDAYNAAKAFDSDPATRWSAAEGKMSDQYVAVDFGKETTYNRAVIKEISYPRISSFLLQYSEDGIHYTDIPGTAGTSIGASKTIDFEPVTSRFMRLWIISTRNESGVSKEPTINEIEVYYNDTTPPVVNVSANSRYTTSEYLTVTYDVYDLSGIYSHAATLDGNPVTNGQAIDLAAMAGHHTLEVTAEDRAGNTATRSVDFDVAIAAGLDIQPDALSLKSSGGANSVTGYIEFPAGYDVSQINVGSVRLHAAGTSIEAQLSTSEAGDVDGDKIEALMVKFDRRKVISALAKVSGEVTVFVTGSLNNGKTFTGSDNIQIVEHSIKTQ